MDEDTYVHTHGYTIIAINCVFCTYKFIGDLEFVLDGMLNVHGLLLNASTHQDSVAEILCTN